MAPIAVLNVASSRDTAPVPLLYKAESPTAVLSDFVVLLYSDLYPMAIFPDPVVLLCKVWVPIVLFLLPKEFLFNVSKKLNLSVAIYKHKISLAFLSLGFICIIDIFQIYISFYTLN